MIGQRELGRNAPKKRFKLPQGCSFLCPSVCLSVTCLSMCTMPTCTVLFFPPKKYFHYSHYTLWEFFFCKAKEPGLCHCPLVQWLGFGVLTTVTQPQSLAVNRSPTSSCCRLKPLEIRNIYTGICFYVGCLTLVSLVKLPLSEPKRFSFELCKAEKQTQIMVITARHSKSPQLHFGSSL